MRLTEDGKLGLGTKNPQATLDVAGTLRASKGVSFMDGTVLTSATGRAQKMNAKGEPEPLISGTGTTGRLAKWTDGGAGALGDSVVAESSGFIGVGTAAPNNKLHVVGNIEVGAASGSGVNPVITNPNNLANFALLRFYPASGTNVNTSFSVVPRGTGQPNNRAQFAILNTDAIADPSNTEFATFRARGSDFVFGTGKTGTGSNRPIMMAAGFLTDNTTNENQLVLATSGNVGVGTGSPGAKLTVEAAQGQIALQVEKGRVVLSYASVADGGTIPTDVAVVEVANNGVSSDTPSVALPASAENGTVIIVGTPDPYGAQITGAVSGPHSITNVHTLMFIRIGGQWRHEF